MNVKTIFRAAMPFCFLILLSCTAEDKTSLSGIMNLNLAADYHVVPVTKAGESESDAEGPDTKDFAITILDGEGSQVNHWDKFSDFPQSVMLPVKSYTLKASYGNPDEEGFDKPYFEGSEPFTIQNEELAEVNVTCMIANVKVTVEYTAAFKKYFKSYKTSVQSGDDGQIILFDGDETREAYVKPGNISITGAYVKQDGKTAEFKLDAISEAKARYHYRIKLDVEAGGQSLNISYDNTTEKVPVGIDISDGALSTKAPFFTLTGYQSGEALQLPSYSPAPGKVSALLTARGVVKTCTLTVASAYLQSLGWPESIDLLKVSDVQRKLMTDLGLKLTGLGANADKMAVVDFTDLIPSLCMYNNSADHVFTLKATDKLGKESEPVVLKITSGAFDLALSTPEAVPAGSTEIVVPVSLSESSDISLVTFKYQGGSGVWNEAPVQEVVSAEGTNYTLRISVPVGNEPVKLKAIYNRVKESNIVTVPVTDYNYTLSIADAADIWASKVVITLNAAGKDLPQIQKSLKAFVKASSGDWEEKPATVEGNRVTVTGLQAGTAYQLKTSCVGATAENISLQPVEFTTEAALQVPNAGMEDWYNKKAYSGTSWGIGIDVYKWFPQASESTEPFWATRNDLTNSQTSGATCYYTSYSGTISTDDAYSGSKAAEISTLGWGEGNTYTNTMVAVVIKNKTAGMLFMGEYDLNTATGNREIFGRPFASRPTQLAFYYKYKPINNESFKAYIVVENRDNGIVELGRGELSNSEAKNNYVKATVDINYTRTDLKATHMYVVFISSTADQPEVGLAKGSMGAFKGYADSRYVGSVLTVDDIQLNYE